MTGIEDLTAPKLVDELTLLASKAAAAIMRLRGAALAARRKSDLSPVTDADEAAESVILEGLSDILPGIPVLSEEASARGLPPQPGPVFILVDPLDGTRELLAGRDEFTVNLAIVADGRPVTGVIAAPALDLVWRGARGRFAQRLLLAPGTAPGAARECRAIRPRVKPAADLRIMVSRSHADAATESFVAQWPGAQRIACGSSLKFCRLAEGSADLYPRLGPTCEWDVAAGDALLTAAGGAVRSPDGVPLPYGRAERSFRIPAFIAWGDPAQAVR